MTETRKVQFRAYAPGRTAYPVTIVTPEDGFYIHTFFDVRPWSPFGNSLACLKLPFQDRLPGPDDTATVCIIDLKEQTITEVGETKGWGMQVGAHVCWGSDNLLYYNDKEGCEVFAVEYNVTTREKRRMAGSIYFMAPDGSYFLSPSLSDQRFPERIRGNDARRQGREKKRRFAGFGRLAVPLFLRSCVAIRTRYGATIIGTYALTARRKVTDKY